MSRTTPTESSPYPLKRTLRQWLLALVALTSLAVVARLWLFEDAVPVLDTLGGLVLLEVCFGHGFLALLFLPSFILSSAAALTRPDGSTFTVGDLQGVATAFLGAFACHAAITAAYFQRLFL